MELMERNRNATRADFLLLAHGPHSYMYTRLLVTFVEIACFGIVVALYNTVHTKPARILEMLMRCWC